MTVVRHINHEVQEWDRLRQRLFLARLNGHHSQDQIADRAGLSSRTTLGRIERGESVPGIDTVIAVADAVGLKVELVPDYMSRLLSLSVDEIKALVHAASRATDDPLLLTSTGKAAARQALNVFYGGRS